MADGGWLAVVGVVVGGLLTGSVALLQNRSRQRFEMQKALDDRRWSEGTTHSERGHAEQLKRRQELLDVYTRYQLAADRFESAVRAIASSDEPSTLQQFEAAQDEYDHATELIRLLAPSGTVELALGQRRVFNRLAAGAIQHTYDDDEARNVIAKVTEPLLTRMRRDLNTAE